MSAKPELEALLERVRAATGPDREIDEVLAKLFRQRPVLLAVNYGVVERGPPMFTGSLDAIRALTKQLLPDSCSDSGELTSGGFVCWILVDRTKACTHVVAIDDENPRPTEPLACIEALLRALIKKGEG